MDHGEGSRLEMFWKLAGLGLRSNLMMTVSRQLFDVSCLSHRDPLYHGDASTRAGAKLVFVVSLMVDSASGHFRVREKSGRPAHHQFLIGSNRIWRESAIFLCAS